ncbi:MAG TPA: NTP transferase domain-containing protein, partial [Candidatus Angelobacter sp.]
METGKGGSRVAAVVLAAGMSSRMGTPKQLLRLGENTLLGHTLGNVRRSQVSEIVLVLGFAAEEIKQLVPADDLKVVINPVFQEGMASSLRAGLSALGPDSEAALIILADQPFIQPATLNQLIDHHQQFSPQILLPLYKGFRGNPVLLDRSIFPELMKLTGDVGCRAIFGGHVEGIHKLPVDDVGILIDVDQHSDAEKLASGREKLEAAVRQMPDVEGQAIPGQPELVIIGQEAVARALAAIGRLLHFSITMVDPLLTRQDLPEADLILHILDFSRLPVHADRYVVVASHGRFDEEALQQALSTDQPYIAIV